MPYGCNKCGTASVKSPGDLCSECKPKHKPIIIASDSNDNDNNSEKHEAYASLWY